MKIMMKYFCEQPEYGRMIACDNTSCQIERFQYECVNIRQS